MTDGYKEVIINIAGARAPRIDPGNVGAGVDFSSVGHVWIDLPAEGTSFGFGPKDGGDTTPDEGYYDASIYTHPGAHEELSSYYMAPDGSIYNKSDYVFEKSIILTDQQYQALKAFLENPTTYGFNITYDPINNSCIDFAWAALNFAGANPNGVTEDSMLLPWLNRDEFGSLPNSFSTSSLNNSLESMGLSSSEISDILYPISSFYNGTNVSYMSAGSTLSLHNLSNVWNSSAYVGSSFSDRLNFARYFSNLQNFLSPLAFDLDGDGIETTHLYNTDVFFDIDADGFAEKVGWIAPDDGMLARDVNGDGIINNITELFGDDQMPAYDKLAKLDTNHDGAISSADTAFSELKIWRDLDQDGFSDTNELSALSSVIKSISLTQTTQEVYQNENYISGSSSFTRNNNSTGTMYDVHFLNDNINTWMMGAQSQQYGNTVEVSPEALILPLSRGYGSLPSLHIAMTNNENLREMMKAMVGLGSASWGQLPEMVTNFLYEWAGVTNNDPNSRKTGTGVNIDARKVDFIEQFMGLKWQQMGSSSMVGEDASLGLKKVWSEVMNMMIGKILVQGVLSHDIFPNASYDFATDKLVLGDNMAAIVARAQSYIAANPAAGRDFWLSLGNILISNKGSLGVSVASIASSLNAASGMSLFIGEKTITSADYRLYYVNDGASHTFDLSTYVGDAASNTINSTNGNDYLFGNGGDDALYGHGGDDYLRGDAGNDSIYGGIGEDTLEGSTGNDRLEGGGGRDHLFGDEGVDTLVGDDGDDRLEGGAGADIMNGGAGLDEINYGYSPGAVSVNLSTGTATGGDAAGDTYQNIENITGSMYADTLRGDSGDNVINGEQGNDTIYGGAGNDNLFGADGNDQLYGEAGDDFLSGYNGAEYMNGGDGNDTVSYIHPYNSVGVTANLTTGQGAGGAAGGDTYVGIENLYGSLHSDTLTGNASNNTLSGYDGNDIIKGEGGDDNLYGGAGNDQLEGSNGVDYLNGEKGDDILKGGSGRNVYQFGRGYGRDIINDADTTSDQSVLMFKSDTLSTAVTLSKVGSDLEISINGTTDKVNVQNYFSGGTNQLESIQFSDGVQWTLSNVAQIIGGNIYSDDSLWGDGAANVINGYAGNDYINGQGGNDTLYGGDDNDYIVGGDGSDTIYAGAGNDTVALDWGDLEAGEVLDGGTGTDMIIASDQNFGNATVTGFETFKAWNNDTWIGFTAGQFSGFSNFVAQYGKANFYFSTGGTYNLEGKALWGATFDLYGSDSADTITGDGASQMLYGDAGDDTLYGGAGDDTLHGVTGDDNLYGGDGEDHLNAGEGFDNMYGGAGNDEMIVSVGDQVDGELVDGGDGIDTLISSGINLGDLYIRNVEVFKAWDNDTWIGVSSNQFNAFDSFVANGGTANVWAATSGAFSLDGKTVTGVFNLYGSDGADTLVGNGAAQVLLGGEGNDIIDGKGGADWLTGDLGSDTYRYGRGYGSASISDVDWSGGPNEDALIFGATVAKEQLWFKQSGNDLQISIIGTNDNVAIKDWYSGNHIEKIQTADGSYLLDSAVQNMVNAMASLTPPAQTTLPTNYQATLNPVIAASWAA